MTFFETFIFYMTIILTATGLTKTAYTKKIEDTKH